MPIFFISWTVLGYATLFTQIMGNKTWLSSKLSGDPPKLVEARRFIEANRHDVNKLRAIFQTEDRSVRGGKGSASSMLKWTLSAVILGQSDYVFRRDMKRERTASAPSDFFDKYLPYGYEMTRARLLFNVNYDFAYREYKPLAERIFKIDSSDIDMVYAFTKIYEPQAFPEDVPKAQKILDRLMKIENKKEYDYGRIAWIHYLRWMKSKNRNDADNALKYFGIQRSLSKNSDQIGAIDGYIKEIKAKTQ